MFCIKIIKSVKEHVTWTDDKRSVIGQVAEYLLLKLEMQVWSQVEEERFPKTVSDPHMCPDLVHNLPLHVIHTIRIHKKKKKKHVFSYQGNVNKSYIEISTPLSHRAVIKVKEMWLHTVTRRSMSFGGKWVLSYFGLLHCVVHILGFTFLLKSVTVNCLGETAWGEGSHSPPPGSVHISVVN